MTNRARGRELEEELAARLYRGALSPAATKAVVRMVASRTHRGTGDVSVWYPRTLEAWQRGTSSKGSLEPLVLAFCASRHCDVWREGPGDVLGISLEEAWWRFFEEHAIGAASVREEELLGAVVRALAVTPEAQFQWPALLRRAPGGCWAVSSQRVLHAALDGRYVCGPITPLVHDLLEREPNARIALKYGLSETDVCTVQRQLAQRRLI